ncbi:uncharacterized protein PGRI_080280 [Penicillium griseofulvum]|uniref:Uncharacterized protein n=1 Tax=Penicillium patulum TaxID=5078 RepID=A0A135LUY0_PENPA|nr:uncharacterized protein PGRI_080280 [Penicillium griseofulvum]KXG52772.1 hypothetical protein PGRI_080280 [Penicillium griseofulvum]
MVQVQSMLGLKLVTNDPGLDNVPPLEMSSELTSVLSKIDNATTKGAVSESNIRFTLDILLVYAHDIAMSENADLEWNKKDYRLVGQPDYAVWYGEIEETALNVVVAEAKKRHMTGTCLIQCLGYMGVVHRTRKASGKENCTVYGMASDDQTFIFLKINEKSEN